MKKKVLWVLVSLAAVAVIVWAFFFPIQRMVTEKKYDNYRSQQGIDETLISSKDIAFDKIRGGYNFFVKYSDDMEYTYIYHYDYWASGDNDISYYDGMTMLLQHDKSGIEYTPPYKYLCKHPEVE